MQIIKNSDAQEFKNAANCHGREFNFADKTMNGALITIQGRYPKTGQVVNEVCAELAFVVSGQGVLAANGQKLTFSQGDTLLINSGEPFYWEGDCTVYTVCTPAFYPEQHKETK